MKRLRGFRPSAGGPLESRLVPSHVTVTPRPDGRLAEVSNTVEVSHSTPSTTHSEIRTQAADGQVQTIDSSITVLGPHAARLSRTTHEADGSTKVETGTSTGTASTTHWTIHIASSDGVRQTETETDVTSNSLGIIQPDGSVVTGPTADDMIMTTKFVHVITQPGLGTETIVGTTVRNSGGPHVIIATDQQVTHFDGTTDGVHILTTVTGKTSTTQTTTTPVGGVATTTVSTSRALAGSLA